MGTDSRVGARQENRWKRLWTKEQWKVVTTEMLNSPGSYKGPAGPEMPPKLFCLILLTLSGEGQGGFERTKAQRVCVTFAKAHSQQAVKGDSQPAHLSHRAGGRHLATYSRVH